MLNSLRYLDKAMQIFFGSSSESAELMEEVGSWLQREEDVDVLLWTDPRAFPLGSYTLTRLIELSKIVDASVFLFGEDDKVWYRDSEQLQPRDNVLLEYGLFASHLGLQRTIACRVNRARAASDLSGLTILNLTRGRELDAKVRLRNWIREIKKNLPVSSMTVPLLARQFPLKCEHVARRLLPEEVASELKELNEWMVVDGLTDDTPARSRRELCRRFVFRTFSDAISFMATAVEQIDSWDHHPRWENTWNQVIVYLTTWSIGHEISALDLQLAHYLQDLYDTKFKHTVDAASVQSVS